MRRLLFLTLSVSFLIFSCESGYKNCQTEPVQPVKETQKETEILLTFDGEPNLALLFLSHGYKALYDYGLVKVYVKTPQEERVILKLYQDYKKREQNKISAKATVLGLIKLDMEFSKGQMEHYRNQYLQLKNLLNSQGRTLNFSPLEDLIFAKRKVIFLAYKTFWDKKFKQILEGYSFDVKKPPVEVSNLVEKAKTLFGDDITVNAFRYYLLWKLYESRYEADLYKYKWYGS